MSQDVSLGKFDELLQQARATQPRTPGTPRTPRTVTTPRQPRALPTAASLSAIPRLQLQQVEPYQQSPLLQQIPSSRAALYGQELELLREENEQIKEKAREERLQRREVTLSIASRINQSVSFFGQALQNIQLLHANNEVLLQYVTEKGPAVRAPDLATLSTLTTPQSSSGTARRSKRSLFQYAF